MATNQYYGTGRRKTSTARVFLRPGNGTITINKNPLEKSFPTPILQLVIRQPLVLTETLERFDVLATTAGGGVAGLLSAYYGVDLLLTVFGAALPRANEVAIDGRVLAFTASIAMATGAIAAFAPAWQLTGRDPIRFEQFAKDYADKFRA